MCHVCIFFTLAPVPSLRARAHLSPLLCLLLVCVIVLILRARVWCSPNWWIRTVITGADAMCNGVLSGALLKQCSLASWWMMAWTSGSLDHWWMMFTVPCWCCACARYCDIPSLPVTLIICPVFHPDCLCRFSYPYVLLTLEVAGLTWFRYV